MSLKGIYLNKDVSTCKVEISVQIKFLNGLTFAVTSHRNTSRSKEQEKSMKGHTLSDAERQRKRRQKLKGEKERAQYAPEQFIAHGVKSMIDCNLISAELRDEIIKRSTHAAKELGVNQSIVLLKYIEKMITEFLKPGEL